MQIYIATPVRGRKENTLHEKQKAAFGRVKEIEEYLKGIYPDAHFVCFYNIVDFVLETKISEARIMGKCVEMVIDSDMVVLDDGWDKSDGCTVERFVAMRYGKKVQTLAYIKMMERVEKNK